MLFRITGILRGSPLSDLVTGYTGYDNGLFDIPGESKKLNDLISIIDNLMY